MIEMMCVLAAIPRSARRDRAHGGAMVETTCELHHPDPRPRRAGRPYRARSGAMIEMMCVLAEPPTTAMNARSRRSRARWSDDVRARRATRDRDGRPLDAIAHMVAP